MVIIDSNSDIEQRERAQQREREQRAEKESETERASLIAGNVTWGRPAFLNEDHCIPRG